MTIVVFAAQAEFAGDVDAGLVGEGHAGFEDGSAAADEIGMLVAVEAEAVAKAMGEEFVAGAVAGGSDDGTGGIVHGAGKLAGASGVESGVLGLADDFEGALNFLAGFAEDAGAGDIGFVAFHGAAAVNQNDVAFLQFLRLTRAMRQRGGSAQQHQGAAAKIHFGEARGNESGDFFLRHTFLQSCKDFAIDQAGGFAGEAHEFELLRRFARAARDDDGIGGEKSKGRRGSVKLVIKGERKGFLDADAAGTDLAGGERVDDEPLGAFVFLPEMDIEREAQRFAHAGFFKGRTDKDGLAGARNDEGQQTFAEAPTNAREVVEGRARADDVGRQRRAILRTSDSAREGGDRGSHRA